MALTPSFPGPTGLATTTDGRKAIAGLLAKSAAGAVRSGVFPRHANALVTARADMNLDLGIFEGVAVQFGGPILMSNDAVAQLPSALVSPGVGVVNYYVIYAKQNESAAPGTDANTNRVFGAQLSTTSLAAARAALPAGALELATVEMPTGKTATNQGGVIITQTHQYTAAAGGVVWVRNTTELTAWAPADGSLALRLDTDALYQRTAGAWGPVLQVHDRQADTTNSVIMARMQSGIGKITGSNTASLSEAVTFPVAFAEQPVVVASFIGYRGAGAFNPAGLTVASAQRCGPMSVTPSGFTVKIDDPGGSFTSGSDWYYQWIAIGAA